MEIAGRAFEISATVDAQHHLVLDNILPIRGPKKVRVFILVPDEEADIDETEWLHAAAKNPSYDFLNDPEEDIYTMNDGKPFEYQE